ncbi:tannase and feruloyl esterase [Sanghuangporus baumii]|uniref:Carboxylic ester hydrolase n=1 Tax=Sanghuangporus baumii TaxID=108892 RepID=A0A9Q5N949_SANBA|nr:tannase and feruloyl esterase [Sanghuangporus baumii]
MFPSNSEDFIFSSSLEKLTSALNSKRLYDFVASTLGESSLDDFYRLFLIPGIGHCGGGTGTVKFGQGSSTASQAQVGSTDDTGTNVTARHVKRADQATDIWDDLINWVEGDASPDTITGVSTDGTTFRTHCRYPQRSAWDGSEYTCVSIDESS